MQKNKGSAVLVAGLGLVAAACTPGPKRPLFDVQTPSIPDRRPVLVRNTTAPPGGPVTLTAPAKALVNPEATATVVSPSLTRDEIDELVHRMRDARGAERIAAVEKLVRLGALSPMDLETALDDARFEADLLNEAQTRSDEQRHPLAAIERKKPSLAGWVEEKYRVALDRYLTRDYLGCLGTIDAILTLEANPQSRPKLDRLKRRARERLVAETVIATTIVPDDGVLAKNQPIHARLVLENKSHEPLVLGSGPGAPLGQIVLDYEELLADGTRSMRRTMRSVAAEGELRIPAGEKVEVKLDLPTEHAQKADHVLGRYRLSGRLRPYTLRSGEEPLPYFLPLFEVFVFVVDPGDRVEATDPHDAFEQALTQTRGAKDAAEIELGARRVFVAALIWAASDRDAALGAMIAALEPASGPLATTLGAALGRAIGEPATFSKDEWLSWWRSSQSRPRPKHADVFGGDDDEHPLEGPHRQR